MTKSVGVEIIHRNARNWETHTITDATGHPCYDASFTPYGEEVLNPNISQTCSSNYKFTGYEYDSETGNYCAFARYYSWRLGRFMTPDPIGGETLDPQSGNAYAYVLNVPCNLIDPFGFAPSCNFNVAVDSPDNAVTGDALKAVEAEIQDIFANSSLNQPVSVGVNFTSGSNADFSLTFSNAGVPGSGGGVLRSIADFGSKWAVPIAIASAAIDATAIGVCTASD